jgi:hypothetical protein
MSIVQLSMAHLKERLLMILETLSKLHLGKIELVLDKLLNQYNILLHM